MVNCDSKDPEQRKYGVAVIDRLSLYDTLIDQEPVWTS